MSLATKVLRTIKSNKVFSVDATAASYKVSPKIIRDALKMLVANGELPVAWFITYSRKAVHENDAQYNGIR